MNIQDRKSNLSAMLHGGTLNKVRNIEMLFERSQNTLLSKIDPIDTVRLASLSSTIHDDVYNYALPSDYKKIIDLFPEDNRNNEDNSNRIRASKFDLSKDIASKKISIEADGGSKFIRVNWRSRAGKTLNSMDSLTANGAWSVVGTANGLKATTIYKISGNASVEFDINASGDGIQNSSMTSVDMTDEDEVADVFVWIYFGSISNLTSISGIWGNDLTTNYWTSVAQTTQADGTAFKVGWNLIKFSWSTATETGTVNPATIDSFKITFATIGAISNVRVDNIVFSIGRNFDIKYYSKFILKNSSGTWITRTTSDDDTIVLDNDAIQILLLEDLIAAAQQLEGTDSSFDISWAKKELYGEDLRDKSGLYAKYRKEHPSQAKKALASYGGSPARGRW